MMLKKAPYAIAILALALTATSCKKKKKKGAQSSEPPVTDVQPVTDEGDTSNLGKEVREGDSVIFRGTDDVFYIKATPHTVRPNDVVSFEGNCGANNDGRLTWEFGDSQNGRGTGTNAIYRYSNEGTYSVTGTCLETNGNTQTGTITISVSRSAGSSNVRPGQNPSQNGHSEDCPCNN